MVDKFNIKNYNQLTVKISELLQRITRAGGKPSDTGIHRLWGYFTTGVLKFQLLILIFHKKYTTNSVQKTGQKGRIYERAV